ncbi:MAG TPA: glycosyltransferase family 2 protein [Candidatus Polarisedimenticolia bacterium]
MPTRPVPTQAPQSVSDTPPDLSVVIPVYNEVENLIALRDELVPVMESLKRSFEILFVNDGSTDGSEATLRALKAADRRLRVLALARNSGQTAAMSAGFSAARGAIIVTLDSDLQNDPRDIPLLLAQLEDHDAAVGWRSDRRDSWIRRVSSRIGNAVRNALSDDDIIDTGCTLKAYRRDALARVKLFTGMHRFLPTLLRMEGYRVCQVKVGHRPRLHGESKYGVRNRLLRSFTDLLAVRWMKRRALRYQVTEEE